MMNADVEMRRVEKLLSDARRYKNLGHHAIFLKLVAQVNDLLEKIVISQGKRRKNHEKD